MKSLLLLLTALVLGFPALASAQDLAVNGVDENGYGGVYEINGTNYWWMCVEPVGTPAASVGQSFLADTVSFAEGWSSQNTERYQYYHVDNPGLLATVVPKQVAVMSYVLDTYLPWGSAGPSGRFIEQDSNAALYNNDDPFYNSFFVVQAFLAETYGKEAQSNFTDLSNFVNRWDGDLTASGMARSALFQFIVNDVQNLDASPYFSTYAVQHDYFIANTSYPLADGNNWQDALVIQGFGAVPEPSGALLIGCCGIVVLLRRCRRAGSVAFEA